MPTIAIARTYRLIPHNTLAITGMMPKWFKGLLVGTSRAGCWGVS